MKKISVLFIPTMLLFSFLAFGQQRQKIGDNPTTLSDCAVLELESTKQGFLPPRMTLSQRNNITSPLVPGLIIWCTNCGSAGQLQIYNGSFWTNLAGNPADVLSNSPNPPTNVSATYGENYAKATVSWTAPNFNGAAAGTGSPYTLVSYTVTATPSNGTTAITSTVTAPTTSTNFDIATDVTYTFSVIAKNSGNVSSISSSVVKIPCGAYLTDPSSGQVIFKKFACHNLGVLDQSLDPTVGVSGIHGDYYQWGRPNAVATSTSDNTSITGWNTSSIPDNSWIDDSKINDPCPDGFKIPSKTQWESLISNSSTTIPTGTNQTSTNIISRSGAGSFALSNTNYAAMLYFGPSGTVKTLSFPAAGSRNFATGELQYRGSYGFYWSSTQTTTSASRFSFTGTSAPMPTQGNATSRNAGNSVRCISQ